MSWAVLVRMAGCNLSQVSWKERWNGCCKGFLSMCTQTCFQPAKGDWAVAREMCSWCNKLGTNPWEKYLRWDSNMLLKQFGVHSKVCWDNPIACRVPLLQSVKLWALLLTKLSLTKLPCEQPHGGLCWLNEWELIWGLRHAFLLSLPKQQISVLFCPKLSKQKSYVATLPGPFTLWFVLTKNLIEGGSVKTFTNRVVNTRLWSGAGNGSLEPLKFSEVVGWMDSSLLSQPPCPNTAWGTVACAGELCLLSFEAPAVLFFWAVCF